MSSRAGLRLFQASRTLRTSFRQPIRRITTPAETNVAPPSSKTRFQQIWDSPVGPKTVHFWAPIMKWGIVLAGISDFARPAENLSLTQNVALMATGAIWTRWCLIIKPKNVFLATVNFFLFCVGAAQVGRIFLYQRGLKDKPFSEEVKVAAKREERSAEKIVNDPQGAAQRVVEAK